MVAAYMIHMLVESEKSGKVFEEKWIGISLVTLILLALLRFAFDYLRARFQETIGYELVARDRIAVGDALKRVSLGYFQQKNTGSILASITTGLNTLENMGIRMTDTFVGGYLNFLVILLCLLFVKPAIAMIAVAAVMVSFLFLCLISRYSTENAPVEAGANKELTAAALEYARGLSVVKFFGQGGASFAAMDKAIRDSRSVHLKIEWGFIPSNCLHLFALKCGTVAIAFVSCGFCMTGGLDFFSLLMLLFFSFSIFSSVEPISSSAHVLGVISDAFEQLEALKGSNRIDSDGRDILPEHFDIRFENVEKSFWSRKVSIRNLSEYVIRRRTGAWGLKIKSQEIENFSEQISSYSL